MIVYELNKETIKKAKNHVKKLYKLRELWLKDIKMAEETKKTVQKKYYNNVANRITIAKKEVKKIESKIEEFEEVIKTKRILI